MVLTDYFYMVEKFKGVGVDVLVFFYFFVCLKALLILTSEWAHSALIERRAAAPPHTPQNILGAQSILWNPMPGLLLLNKFMCLIYALTLNTNTSVELIIYFHYVINSETSLKADVL